MPAMPRPKKAQMISDKILKKSSEKPKEKANDEKQQVDKAAFSPRTAGYTR